MAGISIHAPREGGDAGFLVRSGSPSDISIHAPREGGDTGHGTLFVQTKNFNPRPPRGGRPPEVAIPTSGCTFQSTPPARGATSALPCWWA